MAITTDALDFLGRARERAIVFTISAVLNVILNIILIPVIGVVGAAIATVITYALYTFASAYYVTVELDLRIIWLFRQIVGAIIIASIMAFCVLFLIEYITGIFSLVSVVGVGVGIWLILSISFGYLDLRRIISILS